MRFRIHLKKLKSEFEDYKDFVSMLMVELPVADDSIRKIEELLEQDENGYSEYKFDGYRAPFSELANIVSPTDSMTDINELAKELELIGDDYYKQEVFSALLEKFECDNIAKAIKISKMIDDYEVLESDIDDEYLLGIYLVDDLGLFEVPRNTICDYQAVGEEFWLHNDVFHSSYGYLCRKADLERRI